MPRDDLLHWDQIRLRTEHDFMKAEEIRELTLAAPTKPFTLQLADGRTIDVETRDHVAFPKAGSRQLFLYDAAGKPHFVDAALITGITGIGEDSQS